MPLPLSVDSKFVITSVTFGVDYFHFSGINWNPEKNLMFSRGLFLLNLHHAARLLHENSDLSYLIIESLFTNKMVPCYQSSHWQGNHLLEFSLVAIIFIVGLKEKLIGSVLSQKTIGNYLKVANTELTRYCYY